MTPDEFVVQVRQRLIQENGNLYREMLCDTDDSNAIDENWREAVRIFASLTDSQRDHFIGFVRQVATDTVACLFAVLDGSNLLDGQSDEFLVSDAGTKLNGDLVDLFLEVAEGVDG